MNLPQELLDEIFGYLPSDGGKTLRACSLVAKLWVYPAQRLLFYTVNLNAQTYWLWKQRISPANTGLLSHVRSLTYILTDAQPVLWTPYALIDYLPSFCQLQSLTLCNMRIDSDFSKQVEISPFRHTLSSLQLSKVSLPWIAFATLVDSFPSLRNLDIYAPCYDEDNRRPTTLSRPLRGKIAVDMSMEEALVAFSDRLPGMRVEYDELTLYGSYFRSTPRCYQRIVNTCGKSLQRLNLHPSERFFLSALGVVSSTQAEPYFYSRSQSSGPLGLSRASTTTVLHRIRRKRTCRHLLHHFHKYSCNSFYSIPRSRGFPQNIGKPGTLHPTSGQYSFHACRQITCVGV